MSHNYLDWAKYQNKHSSKSMSDEAVLLPKWFPDGTLILAKYQLGHSYILNYAYFDIQPSPIDYGTPSKY